MDGIALNVLITCHIKKSDIMANTNNISKFFENCAKAIKILDPQIVEYLTSVVSNIKSNSGTIYIAGNGGSLADGLHFAAELPNFRVVPLFNPATITALGNDFEYSEVFSRQLEDANSNDLLICLTTSGKSKNIIKALDVASSKGMKVIVITGKKFHKLLPEILKRTFGIIVSLEGKNTQEIQTATYCLLHALALNLQGKI